MADCSRLTPFALQMSKAASKEAIKRDDFIRLNPPDKNAVFHVPALPSLSENTEDDEDDPEEQVRLQPVNIQVRHACTSTACLIGPLLLCCGCDACWHRAYCTVL